MFAGIYRRHADIHMSGRDRQIQDDINVIAGQKGIDGQGIDVECLGADARRIRVQVGDGLDVDLREGLGTFKVYFADYTASDDTNAK